MVGRLRSFKLSSSAHVAIILVLSAPNDWLASPEDTPHDLRTYTEMLGSDSAAFPRITVSTIPEYKIGLRTLHSVYNSAAYVYRKLPVELLLEILAHLRPDFNRRMSILRVFPYWTDVVNNTPQSWTSLLVMYQPPGRHIPVKLEGGPPALCAGILTRPPKPCRFHCEVYRSRSQSSLNCMRTEMSPERRPPPSSAGLGAEKPTSPPCMERSANLPIAAYGCPCIVSTVVPIASEESERDGR